MSLAQPIPELPQYLQENEISQEARDMISTLPSDQGWVGSHLYQYQGFWYSSRHVEGVLSCQENFRAQESDILLVTTPKSGTTWLKAILFSLVKRGEHYHADPQDHPLLTKNPHALVPYLELDLHLQKPVPDFVTSYASPRLFASHLPLVSLPESVKDSACKVVYLCRNPKDAFVSGWHFANRLRPESRGSISLEEALEKFCRGVSPYGPFWDHVLGYWNESLKRPESTVLFLKYEEMKEEPGFHLRRLAEFLGCPFSAEEEAHGVVDSILKLCSFETLSNLDVNKRGKLSSGEENSAFFRRGEAGDWRNHLTAEMAERIDRITEEKLQGSGFKF